MHGKRHQLLYFISSKRQELKNTFRQQFVPDLTYFHGFLSMGGLKELCVRLPLLFMVFSDQTLIPTLRVAGRGRDLPQQPPAQAPVSLQQRGRSPVQGKHSSSLKGTGKPAEWASAGWLSVTWAFPYASHQRQTQKNIYKPWLKYWPPCVFSSLSVE